LLLLVAGLLGVEFGARGAQGFPVRVKKTRLKLRLGAGGSICGCMGTTDSRQVPGNMAPDSWHERKKTQ
jgi:hypothetical protein